MLTLRPFQRRFIRGATDPAIDTACLSLPRGNGKSTLAAHIVARILTPTDPLFRPGTESVLCAASLKQARIVYRIARDWLEPMGGFRFADSFNSIRISHVATRTRVEAIGSNGRTAMGLVGCPWAICDEPGSWEANGGTLLWDAVETAKGKPGSPLRSLLIGTLAPARDGWWHELIQGGSRGSTYVQSLQGDPAKWDQWPEIRRCNPLTAIDANFRRKLLEERDAARADSRLKARFMSYRLNVPSADESQVLVTVGDWQTTIARPVPDRAGRPVVGVDLGGGRSWSAAVAVWESGRCEALAVAPGVPELVDQEKRDRVHRGTYEALLGHGLTVAAGLRVQPPGQLVEAIKSTWGVPALIVCDRFRLAELQDARPGCPVEPRVVRWSEAAADIRGLRKMACDGPLTVPSGSRGLIAASLAVSVVKNDDQGNTRLIKRSTNNTARDDVAAALCLAAGYASRHMGRPRKRARVHVVSNA